MGPGTIQQCGKNNSLPILISLAKLLLIPKTAIVAHLLP